MATSTGVVVLAGSEMSATDAAVRLACYPRATPIQYDLPRCQPGPITKSEIVRTRSMHSRISNQEGDWFIEVSKSTACDWSAIPADASLAGADAEQVGGLYDTALHLYGQFWEQRQSGIAGAKIAKVLHLKYPSLIPILDTRLKRLYRTPARESAARSARWNGQFRRLYWEAIRQDLLHSDFRALRESLEGLTAPRPDLAALTDLRLLDALAWMS